MNRASLESMKSLQRFILEAQSRILYRDFAKRAIKIQDPVLRADVKNQIRQGFDSTHELSDEALKYRLSSEKINVKYLDELIMFSN